MQTVAQPNRPVSKGEWRVNSDPNIIEGARALAEEFPADSIEPVFREVLSACTELTTPDVVAYFGGPGDLAHAAARDYFGHAPSFRQVRAKHRTFYCLKSYGPLSLFLGRQDSMSNIDIGVSSLYAGITHSAWEAKQ